MSKKKSRGALAGAVVAVCGVLALITGIIRGLACSAPLWEREMARFAPPERTGVPGTVYPDMAEHIAGYLAGEKESFQYFLPRGNGESIPCFHEYELIHMADVRGLIRLDEGILVLSLAFFAGCLCRVLRGWKSRRRQAWAGASVALWGLSLAAAGLLLWAAADFDGLFVTFHRLAFRNDYWLLDPRTDLLIRLMPESLFVDLGLKGLGLAVPGLVLLGLGLRALGGRRAPDQRAAAGMPGGSLEKVGDKADEGEGNELSGDLPGAGGGIAGKGACPDSGAGNQLRRDRRGGD